MTETGFHLLMGSLLFASTFVDRAIRAGFPAWNPPAVGLLTLVLGLIWVGLFAAYRIRLQHERERVLTDRLERTERRLAQVEDAVRRELQGRGDPFSDRR